MHKSYLYLLANIHNLDGRKSIPWYHLEYGRHIYNFLRNVKIHREKYKILIKGRLYNLLFLNF
jgi:hypothetical protein